MHVLKGAMASYRGRLAVYPGFSNDHPWDNYRLCIVVERTACLPIMYVAYVPERLPPTRSVDKCCARWLGRRRCIHQFIMLSSRTSTES